MCFINTFDFDLDNTLQSHYGKLIDNGGMNIIVIIVQ